MKPAPYFEKISYFCRNYALLTELSHVGKLREVREVKGQMSYVLRKITIVSSLPERP